MPAHPDEGSKRSRCMKLYAEGRRPADPEVKALEIPRRVTYRYFQSFKRELAKAQNKDDTIVPVSEKDDGDVDLNELEKALTPDGKKPKSWTPTGSHGAGFTPKSSTLQGSVRTTILPKAFSMSSTILWQAMNAAINEWGWPADITPEMFLDAYLYISFKQRGIILGGYSVIREEDGDNGHHTEGDIPV